MRDLLTISCCLLFVPASLLAVEPQDLHQAICPISTGPVQKNASISFKNATLFFCCNNCKAKFEMDPKAFLAGANHQLAATKQVRQMKCPITLEKIDTRVTMKVGTVRVGFANESAKSKVKTKDITTQLQTIFGEETFKQAFQIIED